MKLLKKELWNEQMTEALRRRGVVQVRKMVDRQVFWQVRMEVYEQVNMEVYWQVNRQLVDNG